MIIRWRKEIDIPQYATAVHRSLELASTLVQGIGDNPKLPAPLFHRNFAAVTITCPWLSRGKLPETERNWPNFEQAILCQAWIGNETEYLAAQRDYLENSKHKAYTSWRKRVDNSLILTNCRDLLEGEDSLWPGGVHWGIEPNGESFAIGVSALLPVEDEFLANYIGKNAHDLTDFTAYELPENEAYKKIYPSEGQDTFGGQSFNYPPTFDQF